MSQRRSDAAAAAVDALAHLPFRLADLTPESFPCSCAHWHMPSITLSFPPCMRQLSDGEPDTVIIFQAENGLSVSGAVFLSRPPPLTASVDKSRSATLPPPSSGGSIHLEPFLPFDMLQPQSIYNPKGAGIPSL